MTSPNQLTLDFEPGLTEQYPELMDCVRAVAHSCGRQLKGIAADLDKSQSDFSRELSENANDNRYFKVRDLSDFIESCGPKGHEVIYWLIEKHLEDHGVRKERAQEMLVQLMPKLLQITKELQSTK